jgi:DNA polymerase III subunit delta'
MIKPSSNWGIVGHEWAVEHLRRSLARGRVAHAYLLAGPRHIGKTTLALRLAQALLCEQDGPDPCLECRGCRRAERGNHPDLRWMSLSAQATAERADSASRELKIGTVREWQRDIDLRPFEAARRVFVLEDAQALNESSSNALLKTLEEPPPYAVLILVAHGAGDLLPTIVSRCRVLQLRPLARDAVAGALRERYQVNEHDAALLAAWSAGRAGWAFEAAEHPELLEQQQQRLNELVRLGAATRVERLRWAEDRAKEYRGEQAAAIEWLRLWQSWWRDVLLVSLAGGENITHLDRRTELDMLAAVDSGEVTAFLNRIDAAQQQLADNVNPQLAFENLVLHVPG